MTRKIKLVTSDGKLNRRLKKRQARNSFDKAMNSFFSGTAILCQERIAQSMNFTGFNVRRFAFWVKTHGKKIARDCVVLLNTQFGTLGGLQMRKHVVY